MTTTLIIIALTAWALWSEWRGLGHRRAAESAERRVKFWIDSADDWERKYIAAQSLVSQIKELTDAA